MTGCPTPVTGRRSVGATIQQGLNSLNSPVLHIVSRVRAARRSGQRLWQPPPLRDARTARWVVAARCPPVFFRPRVVKRRSISRPSLTRGYVSGCGNHIRPPDTCVWDRRAGGVCRARGVAGDWRGVRLV